MGFSPTFSCCKIRGDAPCSPHNEFQALCFWFLISQIDGKNFNDRKMLLLSYLFNLLSSQVVVVYYVCKLLRMGV